MSATGFNAGQHAATIAQADALRNQMTEAGREVIPNFGALTTEGLQGNAAGATQNLGSHVQTATLAADNAVNQLKLKTSEFGQNFGAHDARTSAAIGG